MLPLSLSLNLRPVEENSHMSGNVISHKSMNSIPVNLIAPCGMNCRLCWGFIREKNTCPGCKSIETPGTKKSAYRDTCKIKNCASLKSGKAGYCSDKCGSFPCARLKQLDKRYKTKYKMSMIENLKMINDSGVRYFIRNEKLKWACPECGKSLCVHKPECTFCGYKWNVETAP